MIENNPKEGSAPFCAIRNTWRRLQDLESSLSRAHGIGLDEAILLCCLSKRCNCQGDIARETGLTPTQASRLLGKLETKGMIERSIDSQDKRKMVFTLKPKGVKKLQEVTPLGIDFLNT